MKSKNINTKIIILIVLIVIIISLGFIILNNKNSYVEKQISYKEKLTEATSNNAYVDVSTHLQEVEDSYNRGYSQGYNDGQNNAGEIEYIYHTHKAPEGATITTYNGKSISSIKGECYTEEETHVHSGSKTKKGDCYATRYRCTGTLKYGSANSTWCNVCGACNDARKDGNQCEQYFYKKTCVYSAGEVMGYSCPKTEGVTIDGAVIKY